MKLVYFNKIYNFGDAMNAEIFPALFPTLPWAEDDGSQFVGIGSILDSRLDYDGQTIVFGAGIRSETKLPNLRRGDWDIRFVRGPLSARALGSRFITDSAYGHALLQPPPAQRGDRVAFVPHYATAMEDGDTWQSVCARLGIIYVDPRRPFKEVAQTLLGCRLVISEAMHGAIFADLNRIPWIAFTARVTAREGATNMLKWQDWTQSLDIRWERRSLPVFWPPQGVLDRVKTQVKRRLALRRLAGLLKAQPSLSEDRIYHTRMSQLAEEVAAVQRQYGA